MKITSYATFCSTYRERNWNRVPNFGLPEIYSPDIRKIYSQVVFQIELSVYNLSVKAMSITDTLFLFF